MKIESRIKSYSVLFSFGILAGILCRLTDFFPYVLEIYWKADFIKYFSDTSRIIGKETGKNE